MTGVAPLHRALAAAEYLSRAIRDYRREARAGRVPFAVDELLAAGVDNADLLRRSAAGPARDYLRADCAARTADYFDAAAQALPRDAACRRSGTCWYWRRSAANDCGRKRSGPAVAG